MPQKTNYSSIEDSYKFYAKIKIENSLRQSTKKILPIVFLTLSLALTGCASTGEESQPHGSENDSTPSEPTYKDFENVFFDSKTLIYDGDLISQMKLEERQKELK